MRSRLGLVPSQRQAFAMDFLERRGLQFCKDYGLENAEDKAVAIYVSELELLKAWR